MEMLKPAFSTASFLHFHSNIYTKKLPVGIFYDEGVSGQVTNRSAFTKMRTCLEEFDKNHEIYADEVVIYKSDRYSRDLLLSVEFPEYLKKIGKTIYSITEPEMFEDTDSGMWLRLIGAGVGNSMTRNLSKLVSRGKKASLQRSLKEHNCISANGGNLIPGYRANPKTKCPEIYEPEAVLIREMYNLFINGSSYADIIRYLHKEGLRHIYSKKEYLSFDTVKNWIENTKYRGQYVYLGRRDSKGCHRVNYDSEGVEIFDDVVPAIVSKEVWEKANERIRLNINDSRNHNKYLLKSLVKCNHCNSNFAGRTGKKKNRLGSIYTHSVYKCTNKDGCDVKSIWKSKLDDLVHKTLKKELLQSDSVQNIVKYIKGMNEDKSSKNESKIAKELDVIKSKREAIDTLVSNLTFSSNAQLVKAIEIKIAGIEEEIHKSEFKLNELGYRKVDVLGNYETSEAIIKSVLSNYTLDDESEASKENLVAGFVHSIKIDNDNVNVVINFSKFLKSKIQTLHKSAIVKRTDFVK